MIERLKIKIKQEIKNHCKKQVDKYNFGKRSKYNGNRNQQYVGIVGECVVRDIFDLKYGDWLLTNK